LEVPEIWNDPARAQALGKERSLLEQVVNTIRTMDSNLSEAADLLEMAAEEDDQETVDAVVADLDVLEAELARLEFRRMFSNEMDPNNGIKTCIIRMNTRPRMRQSNAVTKMIARISSANEVMLFAYPVCARTLNKVNFPICIIEKASPFSCQITCCGATCRQYNRHSPANGVRD